MCVNGTLFHMGRVSHILCGETQKGSFVDMSPEFTNDKNNNTSVGIGRRII